MKIVLNRTAKYELLINDEGLTPNGEDFSLITDVLSDETADTEEKARTILYSFGSYYGIPVTDNMNIFAFDDDGLMTFNGQAGNG